MKTKQRFITLLLALVTMGPSVWAEDYQLWIGNTQVTSSNCSNILNDGKFSYYPSTKTLSIKGSYTSTGTGIWSVIDGLIIDVVNNATLNCQRDAISLFANTTIKGEGKLTIVVPQTSGLYAINMGEAKGLKLTIDHANLDLTGYYGIASKYSQFSHRLIIKQSTININSSSEAVTGFPGGIILDRSLIPEYCSVYDGTICEFSYSGATIYDPLSKISIIPIDDALKEVELCSVVADYDLSGMVSCNEDIATITTIGYLKENSSAGIWRPTATPLGDCSLEISPTEAYTFTKIVYYVCRSEEGGDRHEGWSQTSPFITYFSRSGLARAYRDAGRTELLSNDAENISCVLIYGYANDIINNTTILVSDECKNDAGTVTSQEKGEYLVKEGTKVVFSCQKSWNEPVKIYLNGRQVISWSGSDYGSTYSWTAGKYAKISWDNYSRSNPCIYLTDGNNHVHNYESTWSQGGDNLTSHWHACISDDGICEAPKKDEAPHIYGTEGNTTNICTVCGFVNYDVYQDLDVRISPNRCDAHYLAYYDPERYFYEYEYPDITTINHDEFTVKEGLCVSLRLTTSRFDDSVKIYYNGEEVASWKGNYSGYAFDGLPSFIWTVGKNAKVNWAGFEQNHCIYLTDGNGSHISTTINSAEVKPATDQPIYNLSGQRVGKDYKGIVIQNGKKVVIK